MFELNEQSSAHKEESSDHKFPEIIVIGFLLLSKLNLWTDKYIFIYTYEKYKILTYFSFAVHFGREGEK